MGFKCGEFGNIHILKTFDSIYIVNPQEIKIDTLIYSTNSTTLYEDENEDLKVVESATPIYKVKDIPPKSYFKIEDIDRTEDCISGSLTGGFNIHWYADEIHWGNGETEKERWKLEIKSFRSQTTAEKIDGVSLDDINKVEEEEVSLKKEHIKTEKDW